jgi:hypothetical protein
MPLNWNLVQDIDIGEITRNLDVSQLEYLVQHVAFANITDEDRQRFPDRAALKAFLLLQLGVEYLTHLKRPLPTQPDSADLRKALSESQRRVEELEALLFEAELQRERASASCKIYKQRYEAAQREMNEQGDEDGEVRGIEGRSMDPFAAIQKDVQELRACLDERGKAIEQRTDRWKSRPRRFPQGRTVGAKELEELFKQGRQMEAQRAPKYPQRIGPSQGSLPT